MSPEKNNNSFLFSTKCGYEGVLGNRGITIIVIDRTLVDFEISTLVLRFGNV